MHVPKLLVIAATGVALTACGASATLQDGPDDAGFSDARVQVTNNNWSDVRIYAEREGTTVRLGSVTTMGTQVFRLPSDLLQGSGAIRLIADPIGSSDRHVTHRLLVWPGQTVAYTIANELPISHASVRR